MNMCLLEVSMCGNCRSSHFQSEWGVKSLSTGGVKNFYNLGTVTNLGEGYFCWGKSVPHYVPCYFHLPIGPFHYAKFKKNSYSGSRVMTGHHFWTQNGPFSPNKFFWKIIIILIYLLAPFIVQN